jgi:hypothetical protein
MKCKWQPRKENKLFKNDMGLLKVRLAGITVWSHVLFTSKPQWLASPFGSHVLFTSKPQWLASPFGSHVLFTSKPSWLAVFWRPVLHKQSAQPLLI